VSESVWEFESVLVSGSVKGSASAKAWALEKA
jgi:hypothetical protein